MDQLDDPELFAVPIFPRWPGTVSRALSVAWGNDVGRLFRAGSKGSRPSVWRWCERRFVGKVSGVQGFLAIKMRVVFYHTPKHGAYSSHDRVFEAVRRALPGGIDAKVAVSRFKSRGVFRRIYSIIEAAFRQGDVNHIAADIQFVALLLRKQRTLLTIADLVGVHRLKGWRRGVLLFFWCWLPIKRVAMVSVISEATRQDLVRYIEVDPRKVRIVYDPVSADFQPVAKAFNTVKPVVLQMGTRSNKNVERVAQALQGIPCHLRVVGTLDEAQLALLQQCGIEYSSVSGIADAEVPAEYHQCDLLVFVSTFEGFGLPIVEAQATGRPVVTSKAWSMPEVAGDAACLVDPYDTASIREGILKVINDSAYRDRLVKAGFENVKRFQPEKIAQQYADIYHELFKS